MNAQDATLTSMHMLAEDHNSNEAWLQLSQDNQSLIPEKDDWTNSQAWALPFEPLSPSILSNGLATSPEATCSWMGNVSGPTKAKKPGKKNGAN